MRILALAALLIAAPVVAAPPRHAVRVPAVADWTRTVVATPMGFRMGSPQAPVKLVEYGSYTCPHCRAFFQEGMAALKSKYVATGKVSYEFRSFIRNGADVGASLLAACAGPARFFPFSDALFEAQPEWIRPFEALTDADAARINAMPRDAQVAGLAKAGGLDKFAVVHGLSAAKTDACLADKAGADKLTATLKFAVESDHVGSTPNFLVDGKLQTRDGSTQVITTWTELEPRIVKALH